MEDTARGLLQKLSNSLNHWAKHRDYYFQKFLPAIVRDDPSEKLEPTERMIVDALRSLLSAEEWADLQDGGAVDANDIAAANKMLLAAYQPAQPTYRTLFLRRDFRDFKPHRHLRIGDFPTLMPLMENGEIQAGTMSESQENKSSLKN